MTRFLSGLRDHLGAGKIIVRQGLWRWLIAPGMLSLLYLPVMLWLGWNFLDDGAGYLRDRWLPGFLSHPAFAWIIAVSLSLGLVYAGFIVYRNVIMICYAPVLSYVSERVEAALTPGTTTGRPAVNMWRGARRAILMSAVSLGLSVASLMFCLLLLLIPIIGGVLMAVLLPLSQMFLAGHGFIDPTLERKGYDVSASFRFARSNKLRLIGCGCGFTLLAMIPAVGWFIAPGWGIVAGTRTAVALLPRK
jgi:uncharacterized protein involved in cysteine biosynthesis